MIRRPPRSPPFPYPTLFRPPGGRPSAGGKSSTSCAAGEAASAHPPDTEDRRARQHGAGAGDTEQHAVVAVGDRQDERSQRGRDRERQRAGDVEDAEVLALSSLGSTSATSARSTAV